MADEKKEQPREDAVYSPDDVWDIADEVSRRRRSEWPRTPESLHPQVRQILSQMKLIYFAASMHPRIGGDSEGVSVDVLDAALFEGAINIMALVSALAGKDVPQSHALDLDRMQRDWDRLKERLIRDHDEAEARRAKERADGEAST